MRDCCSEKNCGWEDSAIDQMEAQPEEAIESLLPIANDTQHEYRYKALYSLGYINYFLLADSLLAKTYFDSVLTYTENSEFITEVSKFYDGKNFIKISRLPFIERMIQAELDKEITEQEEERKEENTDPEEEKATEKLPEEKEEEPHNKSPVNGKE